MLEVKSLQFGYTKDKWVRENDHYAPFGGP